MHSFTSIIFCLSLQHVSLQSTSKPLHCGIESPPGPWALQFPIPGCRWPHVAAVSKQLKSHPCCWIIENFFCADPFFLLEGMAAYIWERERWEAAGGFLFPMYFLSKQCLEQIAFAGIIIVWTAFTKECLVKMAFCFLLHSTFKYLSAECIFYLQQNQLRDGILSRDFFFPLRFSVAAFVACLIF